MAVDPDSKAQESAATSETSVPAPSVSTVAVGFRAAFWTVVAGILLCACILTFSPYTAMRFYTKLNLKDMALSSAEKYLRWHDDVYDADADKYPTADGKYADALYCAVNNSVYFMNKNVGAGKYRSEKAVYYAKKAYRYADEYLACNGVASLYPRTQRVDAYSLLHTASALHPYVYSYADRLAAARGKAMYILGNTEQLRTQIEGATTQWDQEGWTPSGEDFSLLAVLSAYIDAELDDLGLDEIISQKAYGVLSWKNVPQTLSLYRSDKPFDLFVYDGEDAKAGKGGDGEFTRLYDLVSVAKLPDGGTRDNFGLFVNAVRQNMQKYTAGRPDANRGEHLRYTYYLKTLTDFWRSMHNMSAVLFAQSNYFDPAYADALQQAGGEKGYWENVSVVTDVCFVRDGERQVGSCYLYEWYNWGMLYDYVHFAAAANG